MNPTTPPPPDLESYSPFVLAAIARMRNATPLFTPEERKALENYDGPIVSGDPTKFLLPEDPDERAKLLARYRHEDAQHEARLQARKNAAQS